jgi:hypothetical protein
MVLYRLFLSLKALIILQIFKFLDRFKLRLRFLFVQFTEDRSEAGNLLCLFVLKRFILRV